MARFTTFEVVTDEVQRVMARAFVPLARAPGRFHAVGTPTGIPVAALEARRLAWEVKSSDNGGDYRRHDPGRILGSKWALDYLRACDHGGLVTVPAAGTARLANAIVCGEGIVAKETTSGTAVVADTLRNGAHLRSLLPFHREEDGSLSLRGTLRPRRRIRGPSVLMRQIWDTNYGHWTIELLPLIAIVAEHYDIAKLQILVSYTRSAMREVYETTLGHFGIRRDQIVPMLREPVLVDDLIVPIPVSRCEPWTFAPRVIRILEDLGHRIAGGHRGARRIYVSRHGAGQRHLLNEAEVLDALRPYGFTPVYLERLAFEDQVKAFADAEVIVGNYGANLTNAVFARRGHTMFALTSEQMKDDFFWNLTNLKGGRYISLHGKGAGKRPDLNSDFSIDIPLFKATLAELLGSPA